MKFFLASFYYFVFALNSYGEINNKAFIKYGKPGTNKKTMTFDMKSSAKETEIELFDDKDCRCEFRSWRGAKKFDLNCYQKFSKDMFETPRILLIVNCEIHQKESEEPILQVCGKKFYTWCERYR